MYDNDEPSHQVWEATVRVDTPLCSTAEWHMFTHVAPKGEDLAPGTLALTCFEYSVESVARRVIDARFAQLKQFRCGQDFLDAIACGIVPQ